MNRRDLITLLGGATIAWPCVAMAQQPPGMRKIGAVSTTTANDRVWQTHFAAFRQGLAALGWSEGQNVQFEIRYAGGDPQRFQSLAAELVRSAPDVILATGSDAVLALKQRTRSIPIVFAGVVDPVTRGFVSSISHPGANITGFAMYDGGSFTKLLQLLREIAPRTVRAGLVYYAPAYIGRPFRSLEAAAKSARIDAIELPLRSAEDIQRIARLSDKPDTSLIVLPSFFVFVHRAEILKLAARYHLPAIYGNRDFIPAGGLVSYDSDLTESFRQAALYVDRILRGAKPGDLPVQNPTKYELSINLKTAKALGLTVPPPLLIQADEVIK